MSSNRSSFSATCGSGLQAVISRIRGSSRLRARWASTTENSCATRWSCAAARALRPLPIYAPAIATSLLRRRAGSSPASGSPMITSKIPALVFTPLAEEVLEGLSASPKRLPPKLFYDARGSRLFEQITDLPEYYLTRTERAIFQKYAGEIVEQAGTNLTLIELGAGSASKTRILVQALARKQLRVRFYPVDVSASALRTAVASLNGNIRNLRVHPIVADYSRHVPLLGLP